MSRHRRQPSRALNLDFNVVADDEGPAAAKGDATSLDGSQQNTGAGGRGDAGAPPGKGHSSQTKPPPATPGSQPSANEAGNKSREDGTTGRR
ncbi:hypothetical protein HU200_065560 [Digitaria exilis]|uniref:Uncharacterized protein n=1 Tax=Digitaria exilis TaxID=1010633 RepID=A0A834ZXS1_9POAL|nr:hypothetical protein HU200_065560 [Digitaria exilis]CAB3475472.1 unnamed protein product [Digitaria exilis]